jgi:hypothetical protein
MPTQALSQLPDGSRIPLKVHPNPLLATIAARKLSRREQRPTRTVCINGQGLDDIQPA